jgi:hypothetical protein
VDSFALIYVAMALGVAVVVVAAGRANEEAAREWEAALSPLARRELDKLRRRFAAEQAALDMSHRRAREETDQREVAAMLSIGYDLVVELAPGRRELLRRAALYSRLVGALAPFPPLRPRAFRLRGLAARAAVAGLLHHLLEAESRYRLRLSVLGRGFGIVVAALARGGKRQCWAELEAARADWRTLSDETLESFRVLVTATLEEKAPAGARVADDWR